MTLKPLISEPAFQEIIFDPKPETRGRPRTYHADRASTSLERSQKHKKHKQAERLRRIAVIDMETDPFDQATQQIVRPFACCLYSDQFETIVIWEENFDAFVQKLLDTLEQITEPYTFYAHNGGKFDYMFLMHKLRGQVSFKGRGIMSARIGIHEIRDSFHIIPEKLAAYRKEAFDYQKMSKALRNQNRKEITEYLIKDCEYLFDMVHSMLNKFGMKLSIGQMAMAELKKHYKPQNIGAQTDEYLRQWFFGGRVECLAGRGHFVGPYKLYDVNSMYPSVMSNCAHPISKNYTMRRKGGITAETVFIEVDCENHGALVRRTEDNETTANADRGTFLTTIWEFETALELGLIDKVDVKGYIDNAHRTTFEKFIVPMYEARQQTKSRMAACEKDSREYYETKKEDMFYKFLLNNSYGKFAQNPRRFKQSYFTDPGEIPQEEGWSDILLPHFQCDDYWIWQKPADKFRFNNVGTAASITGAARAVLLRAIHNALDPIYCDTDSIICRALDNVEIHKSKLGAWDLEAEFSEVIVNGKKLYACKPKDWNGQESDIKVKSKGASGIKWQDMLQLLQGDILPFVNPAPTLNKFGRQFYTTRNIRATASVQERITTHRSKLYA